MDGLARIAVTLGTLVLARADAGRSPGDVILATPPARDTVVVDPWFGDDKLRHFAMSFAATTFAYAAARSAGVSRDAALPAAVALSAGAGVGKEIFDHRTGSHFSVRDLVWDALGTLAGFLLVREIR